MRSGIPESSIPSTRWLGSCWQPLSLLSSTQTGLPKSPSFPRLLNSAAVNSKPCLADGSNWGSNQIVPKCSDLPVCSNILGLAELIDNAIEAEATAIEVFGVSGRDDRTGRITLKELAVLDNGEGMDQVRS